MNVKCDKVTDETTRWDNISQALIDLSEYIPPIKPTRRCDYQPQINVIQAALPCATDKEVDEKLDFYKNI